MKEYLPVGNHVVKFDEKRIDAIFAELDQSRLPGAVVGIAINGLPVYRKGFGLACMELPTVLSPTIRMRIASTTKHFTCFAYMLLCEEGLAAIDDPIGKYLPELHPVTHKVTMRQLMGNTGGLRDVVDVFQQFNETYSESGGVARAVTGLDLLSLYRKIDDVNAEPDTAWLYNNGGFLILSVALERITGQPIENVLFERVFKPLGMYDTLLRRSDCDFLLNSATQHARNPSGAFEKLHWGAENFLGAGAMVSTVDDMLRWLAHMDKPRLGGATTWQSMKSPHYLINGTSTGYGLGLVIDRYRGLETIYHGGNALGGNAHMLKAPAIGLDVVILVNREDVWGVLLGNKILDACVSNLEPAKAPHSGPFATGIFCSPYTGRVIQLFAQNGRQIASIGGNNLPVEPDENGVLRPADLFSYMKFVVLLVGDPQSPSSIKFTDFGNSDELIRVEPAEKPDTAAIAGRYRSDPTDTEAIISHAPGGAQLNTRGRFGSSMYLLECLADNIWRTRPTRLPFLGGILLFDADRAKFRYSNLLMRQLPFHRVA
jgi:CubicO group peptidase (beta-lactamase class C family)